VKSTHQTNSPRVRDRVRWALRGATILWCLIPSLALAETLPIIAPAVYGKAELQPGWAHYVAPEFPFSLRNTPVQDGYAMVAYTFNEEGIIDDQIVLAASHPAFGDAVFNVMPDWRLNLADFGARARRDTRIFEFQRRGVLMSGTQRDGARAAFNSSGEIGQDRIATHAEEKTDRSLELVQGKFPRYPADLKGYIESGEAVLEFIVDEAGCVRVPAVVYATNPAFGIALMEEVKVWRFTAPTLRSRPTQASVTRTVQFSLRRR
jgi:TonB family protein